PIPRSNRSLAQGIQYAALSLRGLCGCVMSGLKAAGAFSRMRFARLKGLGNNREYAMRRRFGIVAATACAAMVGVSFAALALTAHAAEYKMTVNRDRLINSANEPQNWLMMNGDYGSTRYSKLAQINRDNVKNLRMVWAMALRGMQDIGQNGPE